MNANAELLNFVYQNSQMGVDTLQQLIEISEDMEFKSYLEGQLSGYEGFHKRARQMLNQNGFDEDGLNAFEKIRTYLMINWQTMHNKSASKIAEMLIVGSTMGIIDSVKKIHRYQNDAEKDILKLMKDLQEFENQNIEKLKSYL